MSLLKQLVRYPAVLAVVLSLQASMGMFDAPAKAQPHPEFTPFIDPLEFDPDWQWFAPIDMASLGELSPKKRASVGWFGSYDRTRTWISRPDGPAVANFPGNEQFSTNGAGDFTWGGRLDLGFVRKSGSGWLFNFRRLSTDCGFWDSTLTERLDRFNDDDDQDGTFFPWPDRNDNYLAGRYYNLQDSLNVAYYNDFEVNKTWRRSPYRYGGMLEPFVGFRYSSFNDIAQEQDYTRGGAIEQLNTNRTTNLNRMVGGQVGARYFVYYHRWRLSADARAFLASNFQSSDNALTNITTQYDTALDNVVAIETTANYTHRTDTATAWGYEIRADAAYQLTKYIGVRGGVEFIELARGIWRGGNSYQPGRNQDVFMAGMTFGVELNR